MTVSLPIAVSDSVPWLVGAQPGHVRQDEQAGEPQGHLPGHGALPRQVSQGRDTERLGQ